MAIGAGGVPMTGAPRVSVIIPFLDPDPRFLDEAIESVFAQSFSDWELLLVNDGSGPIATEYAMGWAQTHPDRVRVLRHPGGANLGISASRNLGLANGRGEFVAFLDSDDVWFPGRLALHVRLLDAHPAAGMVYGPSLYWYSWLPEADGRETDRVPALGARTEVPVAPLPLLTAFIAGDAAVPCPCAVTARLTAIRRADGFEPQFRGNYEDQVFYARMILTAPVIVSRHVLDRYRQHPNSITARNRGEVERRARRTFLEWLERYLDRKGIAERKLRRALATELWALDHPRGARVLRSLRRLRRRITPARLREIR